MWYNNAEWISPYDNNTATPGSQAEDGSDAWIAINDLGGTVGGGSGDGETATTDLSNILAAIDALKKSLPSQTLALITANDLHETIGSGTTYATYVVPYDCYFIGDGYILAGDGISRTVPLSDMTRLKVGTTIEGSGVVIYSFTNMSFTSEPVKTYGDEFPHKADSSPVVLSESKIAKIEISFDEKFYASVGGHTYNHLYLTVVRNNGGIESENTTSFTLFEDRDQTYKRVYSTYVMPNTSVRIRIVRNSSTINGNYNEYYEDSDYLTNLVVDVYEEAA